MSRRPPQLIERGQEDEGFLGGEIHAHAVGTEARVGGEGVRHEEAEFGLGAEAHPAQVPRAGQGNPRAPHDRRENHEGAAHPLVGHDVVEVHEFGGRREGP